MKRKLLCCAIALVFVLLPVACSDPTPIPATYPEGNITTKNVQYNGVRDLIVGDKYVFSAEALGIQGTGKLNVLTNRVMEVCLSPDCDHRPPYDPKLEPDFCRMSSSCELFFAVGQEIFYTYHVFEVDYHMVDLEEENTSEVIYVFASYNVTTGESKDILKIKSSDFEQMYNFIYHDGYVYYNRQVPKTTKPKNQDDYQLSFCRMKLGKYKEEVLFAFENVSRQMRSAFPDPVAVNENDSFFTLSDGRILRVNFKDKKSELLVDGADGILGIFDCPGVYYSDGYLYFLAAAPELAGLQSAREAMRLYRVNAADGLKERLTEDLVKWFFVCDRNIYYEASDGSTAESVTKNSAVRTVTRIDRDGENPKSIMMTLSAPDISVIDVNGAGDSLFFRALDPSSGYITVILHTEKGTVVELGREES